MIGFDSIKFAILIFGLIISANLYSQEVIVAPTEEGEKFVILYDDSNKAVSNSNESEAAIFSDCKHSEDFEEPVCREELRAWLEKFEITSSDLKRIAASENNCDTQEILITQLSESKDLGEYELCIGGAHIKYYRSSIFFHQNLQEPIVFH